MIKQLLVNGKAFTVGEEYDKRILTKIDDTGNDPRNNHNMAHFIGLDQNNNVLFTIYSTNAITFHKEG